MVLKNPKLPDGLGEFFMTKFGVRAAGCVTPFWLVGGEVIGWYSKNLLPSLKLGGGGQGRDLVAARELKLYA